MVLVLCYDVNDDKRRAKLFKRLKGFLTPVQESVFEGFLPANRWNELLRVVNRTIDADFDSVRIYNLCRGCAGTSTLLGCSPRLRDVGEPIIV